MRTTLPFAEWSAARLDEVVKPGLLCAFDFDGTLAPIVTQPEKARLPLGVMQRLVALSRHAPVAIITGRSLADIRARLGFEPDFIVGNHGLEGLPGWERRAEHCRRLCREWELNLAAALQDKSMFDPGIRIESKTYSLSVHYRLARDHAKAEKQLSEIFASRINSARIVPGKCVFNLLPQDAADKGMALESLIGTSGARSAVYVGDDVTDEDVFRLRRPDVLSVRINSVVGSAAEFFLPDRLDIVKLLDDLIDRLRAAQAGNWMHAQSAGCQRQS
jgi:trehalose 6-phosphate phosphatase